MSFWIFKPLNSHIKFLKPFKPHNSSTSSNLSNSINNMILSTTQTLQGHNILQYYGIVTGETIIGANFVKDFFASITDVFGGRSSSYEGVLREAKDAAMKEMQQRAERLGANAIVGIDLDYETIGQNGSMLMVTASGTAVRID